MVLEDIRGSNVAARLLRPLQAADWLICSAILGLMKDFSSSDRLLLMACAKGPGTLKNTKKSESSFKTAWGLERP